MTSAIETLQAAGVTCEQLPDAQEKWRCSFSDQVVLHYWVESGRWFIWGRSFVSEPEAIIKAAQAGRFDWASVEAKYASKAGKGNPADCSKCPETLYWVTTAKGKNMPCESTGESHFGRCPGWGD